MKEGERKWLVLKLACFHVIDIDLTGAFFKDKIKQKVNCQYLPCRSLLLVPSQNAAVSRQWELNQQGSAAVPFSSVCGKGSGRLRGSGSRRSTRHQAPPQGISPSLIILSVTQFTASHSFIKMRVVVEEADPIHPDSCDPHLKCCMAEQTLHFPLQQKPDLQSSKPV